MRLITRGPRRGPRPGSPLRRRSAPHPSCRGGGRRKCSTAFRGAPRRPARRGGGLRGVTSAQTSPSSISTALRRPRRAPKASKAGGPSRSDPATSRRQLPVLSGDVCVSQDKGVSARVSRSCRERWGHGGSLRPTRRVWEPEDLTNRRVEARALVTRMGRDRFAGPVRRRWNLVETVPLRVEAANRARTVGDTPKD